MEASAVVDVGGLLALQHREVDHPLRGKRDFPGVDRPEKEISSIS